MINVYEFLRYQPTLYKQFVCNDLMVVYYYCPQTILKVDVFTHYNILSFVMEGKKLIHRPEKTWLLEAGQCYFFQTGAFNQELYLEEGWRSMNLYIPTGYLQQFMADNQSVLQQHVSSGPALKQVNELQIGTQSRLLSQRLLAYFSDEATPSEASLEACFRALLLSVLAEPGNHSLVAHLRKLTEHTRPLLYSVMETNFMYNLSITEFAQLANLSLPTFKRAFKRVFAATPACWLMQRRLTYARMLLQTTDMSVGDIVLRSGFESGSHFSRVFKQQYGTPPLHYRRQVSINA